MALSKHQKRKLLSVNSFVLQELYTSASTFLTGPVQFAHQYIDMTNQTVVFNATHTGRTCKPAMGFSFAAGTTDGPGAFDFKQGARIFSSSSFFVGLFQIVLIFAIPCLRFLYYVLFFTSKKQVTLCEVLKCSVSYFSHLYKYECAFLIFRNCVNR